MKKKRKRAIGSLKSELLAKAREAALTAIQIFNSPQILFKSETFIVLMVIAWTYMLHAYYRSKCIEYRYYKQGPKNRIFERTRKGGPYRYWELETCLKCDESPIDPDTTNNLLFLIGLRHEIEHQMTQSLDNYLSGHYQACALNFNRYIKDLFGDRYSIDDHLAFSIQFMKISEEQILGSKLEVDIPEHLRTYIAEFDAKLTDNQRKSERYVIRLVFQSKLVNRPGQANKVIEFVKSDSAIPLEASDKFYVATKEVERPKFLPSVVAAKVQEAGFTKFRTQPEHVRMWKAEDAKNPGKGYGVEVEGKWYWYESWIKRCLELCEAAGDSYR
ncbi:MAG: DUF3644 domain-containing protein [Candidatus Poribacteria bacterium]|nr:DUF3644 domain-containing protein [Candidatus Poribacteria bacterium]